jgi:heme/copper-type cytochrome/quinol oxidase subunit 2
MENIIYSVTPLRAFLGTILTIAFLFLLGAGGFLLAVFRTRSRRNKTQEKIERVGLGCASIILLVAGILITFVSANTFLTGAVTLTTLVDDKRIVESNCGTNKNRFRTCISYVIETQANQKFYDFTVPQAVWEKIEANMCYQFTYYPPQSLLGDYLQEDVSASYESTSTITRIEKVNCP